MLENVDLSLHLERDEYELQLIKYQLQFRELALQLYKEKRSLIIVYEGWDASGKGGNIRRVTAKIDPRGYQVFPIAAPKGENKSKHYLWRFWRRLVPAEEKQILIFDRSWYGRVMVERVEGFCTTEDWQRAYQEINEFEQQLVDDKAIVTKFFIHISQEEQLARFEGRKDTPHKSWKLTDEDWRNRQKWDEYSDAINEMIEKTNTKAAPWTIVEGNSKYYARVKVLKTLVESTSKALEYKPREITV